ncbi:hypothetical protein ACC719_11645 [Rhizobium ruizarguesonis]
MEQATRTRAHIDRILLVCGDQNAGKSRLLRHMLGDPRLGGQVPVNLRVGARALSRERCLAVRFTSPHEMGETPSKFIYKIDRASTLAWRTHWRMSYACAVQAKAFKNMPGIVDVCDELNREFSPERIRIVQLAPDQSGGNSSRLTSSDIDGLRKLDVEVITIDARKSSHPAEPGNVRILADFFDFS